MTDWHLLYFFDQQQPRKATVLRQILTNKRTGSTLFWGLRYHYLDYLNAVPRFNFLPINLGAPPFVKWNRGHHHVFIMRNINVAS